MTAPDLSAFSVFRTLASTTATLHRATLLGEGLAVAQWEREQREVIGYEAPGHHTVSLYLQGGEQSFRIGCDGFGGAGKFCVLPDEHRSSWSMTGRVRFMHLYIAPERLARETVLRLDREPRSLQVRDQTYVQAPELTRASRQLLALDWREPAQRLAASCAAEQMLHHLLSNGTETRRATRPRGGLAPAVRRRVRDYIDSHLHTALSLDELAGVAALSTYHFAHMFPVSFGLTPHAWVQQRRIDHARGLLASGDLDLAAIAQRTGFGNASHLSRRFRQATGVTPGAYRRWLQHG